MHPNRILTSIVLISLVVAATTPVRARDPDQVVQADVIVAGGSTAAMVAAFTSAETGTETVLIEPTNWVGGQFTASGVPAVDEAWHRIVDPDSGKVLLEVAKIARDPNNMTPSLHAILTEIGNPGKGWVSRFCFEPKTLLDNHLVPWEKRLPHLRVIRNTVVKRLVVNGDGALQALVCIQRQPRKEVPDDGYDRLPSQDIPDWYAVEDSNRFSKQLIRFEGRGTTPVFIDATEWGELLALSGADYLQGLDAADAGDAAKTERCGQATVFGFVQEFHAQPSADRSPEVVGENMGWGKYQGREDVWPKVWTYRRLRGTAAEPGPGDLCLQNWGFSIAHNQGGNDYPGGHLLLDKQQAKATIGDWQGGVDLKVMAAAEQRAYAWHRWFKSQSPEDVGSDRISLAYHVLGTGHGLSKLPYVRDTRRAIGLDGFRLKFEDLVGTPGASTGTRFHDRVAIGCYPADVHPLSTCRYPARVTEHFDTRPFYVPFRALTHQDFGNLLVAGKTMAQDFMANSATRLHPIEWSTGTAAGVIAAWMAEHRANTREALASIAEIQWRIHRQTPIDWTLPTGMDP